MKRRSFLQGIGASIAALFVPEVVKAGSTVNAVFHGEPLASEFAPVGSALFEVDHTQLDIDASPGDLTEAALEDAIIEIDEFPPASRGKLIAIMPTTVTYWRPW